MKKFNKKQIKELKKIWKAYKKIKSAYYMDIDALEIAGKKTTGIEIELFFCDGGCVGIGDIARQYELLQMEDLE